MFDVRLVQSPGDGFLLSATTSCLWAIAKSKKDKYSFYWCRNFLRPLLLSGLWYHTRSAAEHRTRRTRERERERALVFEKCISNVFNISPSACRCISGPKLSDRPQDYPDEKFRLLLKIWNLQTPAALWHTPVNVCECVCYLFKPVAAHPLSRARLVIPALMEQACVK